MEAVPSNRIQVPVCAGIRSPPVEPSRFFLKVNGKSEVNVNVDAGEPSRPNTLGFIALFARDASRVSTQPSILESWWFWKVQVRTPPAYYFGAFVTLFPGKAKCQKSGSENPEP